LEVIGKAATSASLEAFLSLKMNRGSGAQPIMRQGAGFLEPI